GPEPAPYFLTLHCNQTAQANRLLTLIMCNPCRSVRAAWKSSVRAAGQFPVFGRRKEPHTIIIARGDQIRHFTIRPWLAALIGSALGAVSQSPPPVAPPPR